MVLEAGAVPVKVGYRRSKQKRTNVYVAYSLLIAGIVLCPISIFCKSSYSKTFANLNQFFLYIKLRMTPQTSHPYFLERLHQLTASEVHSYNTRFATNFNICKPSISNSCGATKFSFVASKIQGSILSELKKLSNNLTEPFL